MSIIDKMMRIAGRDPQGNAKAISVNENGFLNTKINGDVVENKSQVIIKSDLVELNIPTYYDSVATGYEAGQAIHPSILFFPTGWNGYLYWMAFTPYPNGNDKYENPSIVASNNGVDWVVPSGLVNPIALPVEGSHLADTELVYIKATNKLRCYWVEGEYEAERRLIFKESVDGINWVNQTVCTTPNANILSPSIEFLSQSRIWRMWSYGRATSIDIFDSFDGITWTTNVKSNSIGLVEDVMPFHPSLYRDDAGYHFVVSTRGIAFENDPGRPQDLYYAYSPDGFTLYYDAFPVIPQKNGTKFETRRYRSDIVKTHEGGLRLYVSGKNHAGIWGMGYYEIEIQKPKETSKNTVLTLGAHNALVGGQTVSMVQNLPISNFNFADLYLYVNGVSNFQSSFEVILICSENTLSVTKGTAHPIYRKLTAADFVQDGLANNFNKVNIPLTARYLTIIFSNKADTGLKSFGVACVTLSVKK